MSLTATARMETKINGHGPLVQNDAALGGFYENLLSLRDVILANEHPRLKLSASARQRLQISGPLRTAVTNGTHPSKPQSAETVVQNGSAHALNGIHAAYTAQQPQVPTHATSQKPFSSSEIDPVLLTKSDDLIRAETHLKRQRIERSLKDEWELRKHAPRDRDFGTEPASLFSLSEIMNKALEIVKPLSGLRPVAVARDPSSDSFDENSYYSSQVNDWSSEQSAAPNRDQLHGAQALKKKHDQSAVHAAVETFPGLASSTSHAGAPGIEFERSHNQPLLATGLAERSHPTLQNQPPFQDHMDVYDLNDEESDYTPPAADAFTDADADAEGEAMELDDDDDSSEYSPEPLPQSGTVTSPKVPFITNNLTHIAAPQPARVSPLAVAKAPALNPVLSQSGGFSQLKSMKQAPKFTHQAMRPPSGDSTSPRNSEHETPASRAPRGRAERKKKQLARKRKREENAPKPRKLRERRHEAIPPLSSLPAVIKDEPVSPPPYGFSANLQGIPTPRRSAYQMPQDVEIVSPGDFRPHASNHYSDPYQASYESRVRGPAGSPVFVPVSSPSAPLGRPRRDDQDLRRVASLHAAKRPYSPERSRAYSPVGPYRAASLQQPLAYQGEFSPREPTTYMQHEDQIPLPQVRQVRDQYVQRIQSPTHMAPPPPPVRRVVMDQYGNKYYASEPQEPAPRVSVAPRASIAPQRRLGPEIVYERAPRASVAPLARTEQEVVYERAPSRAPVAYAPRPAPSAYDEMDQMSMPPPSARRVVSRTELSRPDYAYQDMQPIEQPPRVLERPYYADSMQPPPIRRAISRAEYGPGYEQRVQRQYSTHPTDDGYNPQHPTIYAREMPPPPPPPQQRSQTVYQHAELGGHTRIVRGYSARPELNPNVRYVSRQPSMAPQAQQEFMYGPQHSGLPTRAVSVLPAGEYAARQPDIRYTYQ